MKNTRNRAGVMTLSGLCWVLCSMLLVSSVTAADAPVTPPLLKQMYDGGWPDANELETVHEQFLLQRAVQKKPEGVDEKNFIQSIPGRAQMIAVRLYGTGPEFYDQTWKPDDVVKVK